MFENLPMFPLGSVLFPATVVPLHIFEDRFRKLLQEVMAGEQVFGTVLIERGSEVGGGEVRTSVGTLLQVLQAHQVSHGRWLLLVAGRERILVEEWLEDAPFPVALVSKFSDEPGPLVSGKEWLALKARVRRSLADLVELGDSVNKATFELGDDPSTGSFALAALGPFPDLDKYRILSTPTVSGRCALLSRLLDDVADAITLRLGSEEGGGK